MLKFWITGCIAASYLRAERMYNDYTMQVKVTADALVKIHGYLRCGPPSDLADNHQSPLRMSARCAEVKHIADKNHIPLPGVDLPLPEKADFPLIYDATTFSASTPRPYREESRCPDWTICHSSPWRRRSSPGTSTRNPTTPFISMPYFSWETRSCGTTRWQRKGADR